jgi:hypothetical protein
VKRIYDEDETAALKIIDTGKFRSKEWGVDMKGTYISAPCSPFSSLGIKLPYLLMTIKNVNLEFVMRILVRI